ncbi:MAG: Hsp20/alpha crystallin family protein [Gemmatimonadales bacterium]
MLPTRINRFRAVRPADLFEIDRLLDEVFPRPSAQWNEWRPPADLYETDDGFRVELELPGFDVGDIQVTVERGVLTVTGERAVETEQESESCHVRERRVGSVARGFQLPDNVDAENVKAHLENGVLRVLLPKRADAKPKRIEVAVE